MQWCVKLTWSKRNCVRRWELRCQQPRGARWVRGNRQRTNQQSGGVGAKAQQFNREPWWGVVRVSSWSCKKNAPCPQRVVGWVGPRGSQSVLSVPGTAPVKVQATVNCRPMSRGHPPRSAGEPGEPHPSTLSVVAQHQRRSGNAHRGNHVRRFVRGGLTPTGGEGATGWCSVARCGRVQSCRRLN